MNAESGPAGLAPAPPGLSRPPRRSRLRRGADLLLGKAVTIVLAVVALSLGAATFVTLSGGAPMVLRPNLFALVLANFVALLMLAAVLAGRLTRVWVERRRGSAGSRLHVRLVLMFSVVAVTPTIVLAVMATAFFDIGIQAWFNDKVRTALNEGLAASQGYLDEHRKGIRIDALQMAYDIAQQGFLINANGEDFANYMAEQATIRGLDTVLIYDPGTLKVAAQFSMMAGLGAQPPPMEATELARNGEVAVLGSLQDDKVRAVVQLDYPTPLMLLIERPVDQGILDHTAQTERAVAEYRELDANRSGLQITFGLIFTLVSLLVLFAAALFGLLLANQIARPIGWLIQAAERVRAGDLQVRVPEIASEDEIGGLSRAFNRMTGQLSAQRMELMDAYSQIDERRRFTETVLAGVSAGVIGLDTDGQVELPNRAASELVERDLLAAIGLPLGHVVPEFAPLLAEAMAQPDRARTAEVEIGPPSRRRTLLLRIGVEGGAGRAVRFVVTFDDITELQSAQRKAAWADVARRIAHEIKNPLTPIQLSAERLKRRFTKEITSDPDTFAQCADTIVRHVGDIGRMVDEFSAFARMPQPVLREEDAGRIGREALVLQRQARPDVTWLSDIPDRGPMASCDRRLLGQALTNLLQNAADSIAMRPQGSPRGEISLSVRQDGPAVRLTVRDNGMGLPHEDRARLTEPYVTHKAKGTGLGLAIVKKIMEDHGGTLTLDDRDDGPGAVVELSLPALPGPGPG